MKEEGPVKQAGTGRETDAGGAPVDTRLTPKKGAEALASLEYPFAPRCERAQAQATKATSERPGPAFIGVPASPIVARWGFGGISGA